MNWFELLTVLCMAVIIGEVSSQYIPQCPVEDITCPPGSLKCANGKCVFGEWSLCDGYDNCGDNTDESAAICDPCPSDKFQCANGKCIWAGGWCDGYNECGDNSDETSCDPCPTGKFQCANGKCIWTGGQCDGWDECGDNSDESNCDPCPSVKFQCANGNCLYPDRQCDGYDECGDNSDELNCDPCPNVKFQCANGKCIYQDQWYSPQCDGYDNCGDNSDESNCDPCPSGKFQCANGKCISAGGQCDGYNECGDNSDESNCDPCPSDKFQCANGGCKHPSAICNGYDDCGDNSDELACCNVAEPGCPAGFVELGSNCYQIVPDAGLTWAQALTACANGSLLIVDSEAELTLIRDYIRADPALGDRKKYWTAGTETPPASGNWTWMDSNAVAVGAINNLFWGQGEPNNKAGNEYCLNLLWLRQYLYNDARCSKRFGYICKTQPA